MSYEYGVEHMALIKKADLLAAAVRDANEHWSDENWPYGPDRIGFAEKHAEAIEIAKEGFI